MESVKQKQQSAFDVLKDTFGYSNYMESPRLLKVVINIGTGSIKDKERIEIIEDRLRRITGQQPVRTIAKQSIAAFGLREGTPVGFQVTLRGDRMFSFLDKLIHLAMPRMKDFHGISTKPIDEMGNYTIGILEHTIFPETSDEELRNVFGMGVTIVTTAGDRDTAKAFFEHLGFPFQKEEDVAAVAQ